jgi:lipopolysaccharide/colanic/teichoic acid biosynthesis glycosyltransferase
VNRSSEVAQAGPIALDTPWNVLEAGVARRERVPAAGAAGCLVGDAVGQREDAGRQASYYLLAKQIMDAALSSGLLIVLSPLFLLIGLLIKLDSSGPIFFLQDRVGYDPRTGRQTIFKMRKFRTMRHGADQSAHRAHVSELIKRNTGLENGTGSLKMANDSRITRVGRWLRKSSLDELPQLINVILGEMSLVGPRPALVYEVEMYEEWHTGRLKALPGMTGWWQVAGRNQVSFDDMVCMDMYYIQHGSLGLDFKILLLTPLAVFAARGAG